MKFSFAFVFWITMACIAAAQKPYSIHLDKSNGLPCNEIYNMHQDKGGYIWIACDLGLFRYDGFEFRPYYASNMSSKSGSYIREDNRGRIWYSTFDAQLYYVEHDTLKSFVGNTTFAQTTEYAIIGNNLIAAGRKNNLRFLDINSGKLLREVKYDGLITSLYQMDSLFSVGDGRAVTVMDKAGHIVNMFKAEKGGLIYKVVRGNNKFYSLELSQHSVQIFEITNQIKTLIYEEALSGNINGFFSIDSKLYILKKEGLTQIDMDTYASSNSLMKGSSVSHIIIDKNGFLWISTSLDGITVFPAAASMISYELPIVNCRIRIIGHDLILFNTKGAVYAFDMETCRFEKVMTDKSRSTIYDVIPFEKGSVSELTENENYSIIPYDDRDLLVLKSGLKEIQKINNKYIAAAVTGFAGLYQIRSAPSNEWDTIAYHYRDTLVNTNAKLLSAGFAENVRTKSVCYDSISKVVYFATNLGLITATPDSVSPILFNQKEIYAAKVVYADETFYAFLHSGEILSRKLHNMLMMDKRMNAYAPYNFFKLQDSLLFLGTAREFFYVNITDTDFVFKQIPFSKLIAELNDIVYYDGYFYLSVNDQLIKINKSEIGDQEQIPFYINYIESNTNRYYVNTGIKFEANEKDVKINFSAIDFFQRSPIILYKINNEAWQKCGIGSRTITLASLAPDYYAISFSVNGKIYSDVIRFTVSKPWYLTGWFFCLAALVLLLTIYLFAKNRLIKSKKDSALLLEKANLEKDLRQSMLSSIKSQMNPHFLFNALNTIQSYIITEDKANASNYLSKFSKLTRKILEMSDRETIALQEEIEALMLYIELEKMRFQELNYTIEIDKNIDTQRSKIPSMIIQPYVENAIKHGLLHKNGEKQLFISITQEGGQLLIRIEDNGIGRERSRTMQNSRSSTHSSFASHANMKRVELLNIERNEIGVEYVDKKNDDGDPSGTVIIIKIPLKESK